MYYYFYGNECFALKINGVFLGIISSSVQHVNVEFPNPYVEFCPLSDQSISLGFLLNEEFLSCPPTSVSITDLKGGYLISYFAPQKNLPFKMLNQKKWQNLNATVYCDGQNKISIEKPDDFFLDTLDFDFSIAEIFYLNDSIILLTKNDKNKVLIYSLSPKIKHVRTLICDECEINSTITLKTEHKDIQKHNSLEEFSINNGEMTLVNKQVKTSENFSVHKLNDKVIPYAFLDEFLVSKNVNEYLTDEVRKNADKLSGYLGNFIGVMPPPFFRRPEEVGLIYAIKNNVYTVEYFTFSLEDRKICNINKINQ